METKYGKITKKEELVSKKNNAIYWVYTLDDKMKYSTFNAEFSKFAIGEDIEIEGELVGRFWNGKVFRKADEIAHEKISSNGPVPQEAKKPMEFHLSPEEVSLRSIELAHDMKKSYPEQNISIFEMAETIRSWTNGKK